MTHRPPMTTLATHIIEACALRGKAADEIRIALYAIDAEIEKLRRRVFDLEERMNDHD